MDIGECGMPGPSAGARLDTGRKDRVNTEEEKDADSGGIKRVKIGNRMCMKELPFPLERGREYNKSPIGRFGSSPGFPGARPSRRYGQGARNICLACSGGLLKPKVASKT
jgi:hypothetical protein